MSRTPGRRSERPDEEPELKVDQLAITDVGRQLADLGQRLNSLATYTYSRELRASAKVVYEHGYEDDISRFHDELHEGLRRTLSGMHDFRRSYDYWERVIAELALREGMTQRQVAGLMGVSTATINRWAQHPVTISEER